MEPGAECRRHARSDTPTPSTSAIAFSRSSESRSVTGACLAARSKSSTADHLLSVARGGGHELENLVGACSSCNQRRGGAEGRATMKRRRS